MARPPGSGPPDTPRGRGREPARKPSGDRRRPEPDDTVRELTGPLKKVLARLPDIERRVVELRMGLVDGHPADLADTARAVGVGLHEAREIEQRAFERIRAVVPLDQLQRFLKS